MTRQLRSICIGINFPGDSAEVFKEVSSQISKNLASYIDKLSLRHPMLKIKFCMDVSKDELKKIEEIVQKILEKKTSFFISAEDFLFEKGRLSMSVESEGVIEDIRFQIFSEMENIFPEKKRMIQEGFEKLFIPKITLGYISEDREDFLKGFILSKDLISNENKKILKKIHIRNLTVFQKSFPDGEWKGVKKFKIKSMSFRFLASVGD